MALKKAPSAPKTEKCVCGGRFIEIRRVPAERGSPRVIYFRCTRCKQVKIADGISKKINCNHQEE